MTEASRTPARQTTNDLTGTGTPKTSTLIRLAATGSRADLLRITLTAIGAAAGTLALHAVASVMMIGDGDGPYRLEVLAQPGLRPGVIVALLLLCIPLITFVGHCSRIGAPARDRRLAMIRMAGATPREAAQIAAAETGLAAGIGALAGTVGFVLIRPLTNSARSADQLLAVRWLPTDVTVPWWAIAVVTALIPLLATLGAIASLRKVAIGPFGFTRHTITRPPAALPAFLFLAGTAGLIAWDLLTRVLGIGENNVPLAVAALSLFLASAIGLLSGSASIAAAIGRFLSPRTRRPALLIAARRMIAAPHTSSRATTSVLLAVLIGSAVQGVRANFLLGVDPADAFYADTFALVNGVLSIAIVIAAATLLVTSAESIVSRRRTLAALKASGTPTAQLATSAMYETVLPLIPAVLLSAAAGVLAARGLTGTTVVPFDESIGERPAEAIDVPIPWEGLAVLTGGTILACCTMTAISLVFLGRSAEPSELRAAA